MTIDTKRLGMTITAAFCSLLLSGCYSLSGVSIAPEVETYYVANFKDNAQNAPAPLSQDLTEALKEKIRTESRLAYSKRNPDVEFTGTLVDYRITSEAPRPGELVAINRLTIVLAVEYINNTQEDAGWKSNFSFFFDFPANQDFNSIEQEANAEIISQLMEDIFNRAFTDW